MFIQLKRKDFTTGPAGVMAGYIDPKTKAIVNVCRITDIPTEIDDEKGKLILEQNPDIFMEVKQNEWDELDKFSIPIDVDEFCLAWLEMKHEDKAKVKIKDLNEAITLLGGEVPAVTEKKIVRIALIDDLVNKR